jgi:hypothetical protein
MKAIPRPFAILSPLFSEAKGRPPLLRRLVRALLMAVCFFGTAGGAGAAVGVSLEWDANTEPEVAGYKLHYGTAQGVYPKSFDAGNSTTATIEELIAGQIYYFVVTAYDGTGTESLPSNEVSFMVPFPPKMKFTYLANTTPQDKGAAAISCVPAAASALDGFSVTATTLPGGSVSIFTSEDMQAWTLQGTVANPTGRMLINDMGSLGLPKRFYRLSLLNPN